MNGFLAGVLCGAGGLSAILGATAAACSWATRVVDEHLVDALDPVPTHVRLVSDPDGAA